MARKGLGRGPLSASVPLPFKMTSPRRNVPVIEKLARREPRISALGLEQKQPRCERRLAAFSAQRSLVIGKAPSRWKRTMWRRWPAAKTWKCSGAMPREGRTWISSRVCPVCACSVLDNWDPEQTGPFPPVASAFKALTITRCQGEGSYLPSGTFPAFRNSLSERRLFDGHPRARRLARAGNPEPSMVDTEPLDLSVLAQCKSLRWLSFGGRI